MTFWVWPWALWHVAWLAGMTVVPALGWPVLTWYLWLYVAFLPLEIAGVLDLRDDADKSVAKTLSQWRQYVAGMAKPGSNPWLSWKGLAGGTGVFDGVMLGLIVRRGLQAELGYEASLVLASIAGVTLALWLVPHFREA